MNHKLRMMRILLGVGAFLLVAMPTAASAHDNLGGDELAVANWMLIGAIVTIILGVFMGLWAVRSGQFNNVEESKYTMLQTAEDYDAIMAEAAVREAAAKAAEANAKAQAQGATASPQGSTPEPATSVGNRADQAARV